MLRLFKKNILKNFLFIIIYTLTSTSFSASLNCAEMPVKNYILNHSSNKINIRNIYSKDAWDNALMKLIASDPRNNMHQILKEQKNASEVKLIDTIKICEKKFYKTGAGYYESDWSKFQYYSKICEKDRVIYYGPHTAREDANILQSASLDFKNTNLYNWLIYNYLPEANSYIKSSKKLSTLSEEIVNDATTILEKSINEPNSQKKTISDIRIKHLDKNIGSIGCKANLNFENIYLGKIIVPLEYSIEITSEKKSYITIE